MYILTGKKTYIKSSLNIVVQLKLFVFALVYNFEHIMILQNESYCCVNICMMKVSDSS